MYTHIEGKIQTVLLARITWIWVSVNFSIPNINCMNILYSLDTYKTTQKFVAARASACEHFQVDRTILGLICVRFVVLRECTLFDPTRS